MFTKKVFLFDVYFWDLVQTDYVISSEDLALWVPQVDVFDTANNQEKTYHHMVLKPNWDENSFIVPQISPPSFKKTKHFQ